MTDPDMAEPVHPQNLLAAELQAALWSACLTRGTIHVGREPKSVVAAAQQKTAEKTAQTPAGFTLLIGEEESAPRDKQPIEWCSSQMVFRSALV